MRKQNKERKFILDYENPRHAVHIDQLEAVKSLSSETGKKGTLDMLVNKIRKMEVTDALAHVSKMYSILFKNDIPYDESKIVTRQGLAFIAKVILIEAGKSGSNSPTVENIIDLNLIYNDLLDFDFSGTEKERNEGFTKFLIREIELSRLQTPYFNMLPRTYLLYDKIPKMYPELEINIPEVFKSIVGLEISDYLLCGLAFAAAMQHGNIGSLDQFKNSSATNFENINTFISYFATDVRTIRSSGRFSLSNIFEINPLKLKPIIWVNEDQYFCPILSYLWDAITTGVYYVILDNCGDPERFMQILGKPIFEDYIGILLREYYDDDQIIPEKEYKDKNNQANLSTDWTVLEGYWATLIECKTKRLRTKQVKEEADLIALDEDLLKGVVKGLSQIHDRIKDIHEIPGEFPELSKVRSYIPLIVTLDRNFMGNTIVFKRRINELLKANYDIKFRDYHIVDILELENIIPIARTTGKRKTLRNFIQTKAASQRYEYESYWNYIVNEYKDRRWKHRVLQRYFDRITKEAISTFFPGES